MANALTNDEKELIELMYKEKMTARKIAEELGRSPTTIGTYIKKLELGNDENHSKKSEPPHNSTPSFDARRSSTFPAESTPRVIKNMPSEGIRRGQIYYVTKEPVANCEEESGRPGVVVSNDRINGGSGFVQVVFLTTKLKKDAPTRVTIYSSGVAATALCETIQQVSKTRLKEYCGVCSNSEMATIDVALANTLGLNFETTPVQAEAKPEPQVKFEDDNADYKVAMAERDIYKALYNELVEKLLRR